MAIRFRKTIKLAPGIRWNLSAGGSSFTLGPRGASVNIGKRGVYSNTSIPGTGLSSRTRIGGGAGAAPRIANASPANGAGGQAPQSATKLSCSVGDDGVLRFVNAATGEPVPEALMEAAKKQNRDAILGLIQAACDQVNDQVESLGRLHHDTPDPRVRPGFQPGRFELEKPQRPTPGTLGFVAGLLKKNHLRLEEDNAAAQARYEDSVAEWERQRRAFDAAETKRRLVVEKLIHEDTQAMEDFLEWNLQDIAWPRETSVAIGIVDDGLGVHLDVDLPEIEDMPRQVASVPARGLKLLLKDLPATKVRRLYLDHIHGITFRLVGETFAALPRAQTVAVSGFSQRTNKATGQVEDQYLLSVRVRREAWEKNAFDRLQHVDVVEALAVHDLRRDMTRSGELRAIEPHASGSFD